MAFLVAQLFGAYLS